MKAAYRHPLIAGVIILVFSSIFLRQTAEAGVGNTITQPRFQAAKQDQFIENGSRGIGICMKQNCRFYPLEIILWHEAINDTLDGEKILITYTPTTGTMSAYSHKLNFNLKSSEIFENGDLLLSGATPPSSTSFWSQIDGTAKANSLASPSRPNLQPIAFDYIQWQHWKAVHPGSTILSRSTGLLRPYGIDPYEDYYRNTITPAGTKPVGILPAKTPVIGLSSGNTYRAYEIDKIPIGITRDTFAGKKIEIIRDAQDFIIIQDQNSKRLHPSVRTYWFAWKNAHPKTTLFTSR